MNWAVWVYLIKGVSLGFEIVDEGGENFFVIDLFILRIGLEFERIQ